MKVLIVDATFGLNMVGGCAERSLQMSRSLVRLGDSCTVLTLDFGSVPERFNLLPDGGVVTIPCWNKRFFVPALNIKKLAKLVRDSDVVHLMSYWSVLNAVIFLLARWFKVPYVMTPAGALHIFGRSRWLKKGYNYLIGRKMLDKASKVVAITHSELNEISRHTVPAEKNLCYSKWYQPYGLYG